MVNSIILAGLLIIIPAIGLLLNLFFSRLEDSVAAEGKTRDWILFIMVFIPCVIVSSIMLSQIHEIGNKNFEWLPGLTMGIRTTELAITFACIITNLSALLALFSITYMSDDRSRTRYWFFFQLTMLSMMVAIFSNNLFWLFGGIELASISAFFLISHWHRKSGEEGEKASKAAIRFLVMSIFADIFLLLGFSFLIVAFDTSSLEEIIINWLNEPARIIIGSTSSTRLLIKNFIVIGSLIKSAQFPILLWTISGKNKDTDLAKTPLPIANYIISVTIGILGLFVIGLFFPIFASRDLEIGTGLNTFHNTPFVLIGWFAIGTLIILIGYLLTSSNLNRFIIGLATSQISFSFLGLSSGSDLGFTAAVFQLLIGIPASIVLALIFGQVIDSIKIRQISRLGGFREHSPILYWLGIISIVSFAGLLPFGTYFSRDMLFEALRSSSIPSSLGLLIIAVICNLVIIFTVVKTFLQIFHGELNREYSIRPIKTTALASTFIAVGWLVFAGMGLMYYGYPSPHMTGGIVGSTFELQYDSAVFSNWILSPIILILTIGTLVGSYFLYRNGTNKALEKIRDKKLIAYPTIAFENGLYLDNFYEFVVFQPIQFLSKFFAWTKVRAPFASIIWAVLAVVVLVSVFIITGGGI
jgi:NADH-quinone oxidoreductase subunit L